MDQERTKLCRGWSKYKILIKIMSEDQIEKLSDCESLDDLHKLINEDEISEEEYQDMVSYIQDKISKKLLTDHRN